MRLFRAVTVVLVAFAAGCANAPGAAAPHSVAPPSHPGSSASPPLSDISPSIDRRPSGPPRGPTDSIKKTTWIVGTITTGGSGPCYGLATDDGREYALYSTTGLTLTRGDRMRVNTRASKLKIDCGPGTLVEMTAVQPVR